MPDNEYTHIFIAYASQDKEAHDTFWSHLKVLENKNDIKIWSKAKLDAGVDIEKVTQAELQKADIVIFLVSIDLLNSHTYQNIKNQVQTSTTLVAVLLRDCEWRGDTFLEKLQPLPKNEKFITEAENKDKVYTEIVGDIKKMVVGKAVDVPLTPPVNTSPFWKKSVLITLVAVLILAGIWSLSSLFNDKVEIPIDDGTPDEPLVSTTFIPAYGTPIFTTDTSLFKILIIRFEDNLNEDDDTYCIGRSILENFIQLKTKDLPIHAIYADTIASPKYSDKAESIQNHHNADVLIYGLANEIQEGCTAANVCFRHVVANTIMVNLGISKDAKRIKHDAEYETMSHSDIEKGRLSVDKLSMEAWAIGLVALKNGDEETFFKAIETMTADISHLSHKEQTSRFFNQGMVYLESGYYKKAITSHTKAIEIEPDSAYSYNNRGNIYLSLKEYEKAISDYNKAIELKPDYAEAYNGRAIIYRYSKLHEKAILDYNKAIEIKPDYAEAYIGRGITYCNNNKEYRKAILDFNEAIDLKRNHVIAHFNRGVTYRKLEEHEKAISDFNRTIELKPNYAKAYNFRGNIYKELKQYEKAISDLNKSIELDSNDASAYYNRGNTHYYLKAYKKAILDYKKVIELDGGDVGIYKNRGMAYHKLKEDEKAISDYNKAIELNPENSTVYYKRGTIYSNHLKDYKKAILDFDRAIELKLDYVDAYYNRGITYARLNDYEKAILDYDKAIQLKPNYAKVYNSRGAIYSNNYKEYKKAIVDFDKAIQLSPESGMFYYNRAVTYERLQEYKKSNLNYNKALELGHNFHK